MTLLELEEQIKSLYDVFFEDMKIDKQTGILEQKFRDRILRFFRFTVYWRGLCQCSGKGIIHPIGYRR